MTHPVSLGILTLKAGLLGLIVADPMAGNYGLWGLVVISLAGLIEKWIAGRAAERALAAKYAADGQERKDIAEALRLDLAQKAATLELTTRETARKLSAQIDDNTRKTMAVGAAVQECLKS